MDRFVDRRSWVRSEPPLQTKWARGTRKGRVYTYPIAPVNRIFSGAIYLHFKLQGGEFVSVGHQDAGRQEGAIRANVRRYVSDPQWKLHRGWPAFAGSYQHISGSDECPQ